MATKFSAEVRLTHTYIDQCSHMDKWGERFEFKALGEKKVEEGNYFDDLGTIKFRVIGDKRADQTLQARAIASHFGYSGCTHEYDCCGCYSRSASVSKVKPGIFSVLLSTSRNY